MKRFQITIIITSLFVFAYGQTDSDFIPALIQKESIDSCIVYSEYGNYPQTFVFDHEGKISRKHYPSSYVASIDSVVIGTHEVKYFYDEQGRLVRKTSSDVFPQLNMRFENLSEEWIYDLEGQVINELHYIVALDKMITYSYQDQLLVSELITEFRNPKAMSSIEIDTYKRLYQYDQDRNLEKWIGHNAEGTVIDSCTIETDSSNFVEYMYYFEVGKQSSKIYKQTWVRYFDHDWRLIKIRKTFKNQTVTYDYNRNDSGLITEIRIPGQEGYEYKFEYK